MPSLGLRPWKSVWVSRDELDFRQNIDLQVRLLSVKPIQSSQYMGVSTATSSAPWWFFSKLAEGLKHKPTPGFRV